LKTIPGPKSLPIIGNAWRFIPFPGKLSFHYVFTDMLRSPNKIRPFLSKIHLLSVQSNSYFTCIGTKIRR
jgi:hypothetical protein